MDESTDKRNKRPQEYLSNEFMDELVAYMKKQGTRAAHGRGKVVGFETRKARYHTLQQGFKELKAMGFRLPSPTSLQEKHVKALALSWEAAGLSAATISSRLSVFRVFAEWIGKPRMVKRAEDYVANPNNARRSLVAKTDKSWSAKDVDADALIAHVSQFDPYVGIQLKLAKAFGMRKSETVMFKPLQHVDLEHGVITIRDGTKGGRERTAPIKTDEQKLVIEECLSRVSRPSQSLSHPDHNLAQAKRRFNYVCERFGITKKALGVTAHGLRVQNLNDMYEELTGMPSPVRNYGNVTLAISQIEHDLARALVSQHAGHSRVSITNAYIGSGRAIRNGRPAIEDRIRALVGKRTRTKDEANELSALIDEIFSMNAAEKARASRKEVVVDDVARGLVVSRP